MTLWTVARRVPLSVGFPRQEYWSGLPFPSPGDLPDPGIKPMSPALAGGCFTTEPPGKHGFLILVPNSFLFYLINVSKMRLCPEQCTRTSSSLEAIWLDSVLLDLLKYLTTSIILFFWEHLLDLTLVHPCIPSGCLVSAFSVALASPQLLRGFRMPTLNLVHGLSFR